MSTETRLAPRFEAAFWELAATAAEASAAVRDFQAAIANMGAAYTSASRTLNHWRRLRRRAIRLRARIRRAKRGWR